MSVYSKPARPLQLLALTPEYQAENHRVYLDAVEAALANDRAKTIRNIALTGSYGTGKSSVLQQVAKIHSKKVIQISLSTLGIEDVESDDSAAHSKTNGIQKEIVKQFLYSEDPAKTPGSRFHRISRLNRWRELAAALLVGPIVALVFLLAGWADKLIDLAKPYVSSSVEPDLPLIMVAVILLVASCATMAVRYLTHHRLRIEKVTAGPATITLAEDSTSFFDRYLDEIVYFFDITKYDIVIFEDIDRFDDPHIFETLRALNTLLNGARQLQGRNIRFIYAIKDSIFDELGLRAAREAGAKRNDNDSAQDKRGPQAAPEEDAKQLDNESAETDAANAELARANRTKFFDLVIPIVPFITHLSARDVMGDVMKEIQHRVSNDLIDLAARHLADMRFIKNARNEFVIFRERVLPKTKEGPELAEGVQHDEGLELSENSLFAMMLYKGTHLSDFEAIRLGTSKLDLLYEASRNLVTENVARLDAEARDVRRRIALLDSVESRSARLGNALATYVERSAQQVRVLRRGIHSISLGGRQLTVQDLGTADFWARFVSDEGPLTVTVPGFQPRRSGNIFDIEIEITRGNAEEALGEPLSLDDWQAEDRAELPKRLAEIGRERDFLLEADMGDLIARPDLMVSRCGRKSTLADLSQELLGSVLARRLVAAGYINRDFTLYSSTYYGERVSARARNFLMHNVDRNVADFHFALTPQDVDAVLGERDESVLRERGSYNIAVLDRLLSSVDIRAELLVGALITFGEHERQFLRAYLTGGEHRVALIERMVTRSPRTFRYLVAEAEVDEAVRAQLVGAALRNINPELDYELGTDVRRYFEANYVSLTPIVDRQTNEETAARITTLLASMDARLEALQPLGPEVLKTVVAKNRYVITRENLLAALGSEASLALDAIRTRSKIVYRHVLAHSTDYLATLNDDEVVIQRNGSFAEVIKDIIENADSLLPTAVHRAAEECVIADLKEVTAAAWPTLAVNGRFPATFSNVTAYISEIGGVEENLGSLLAESKAILGAPDDEKAKQALASQILSARIEIPSPETRTDLVASLDLDEFIPPTAIISESGHLLGLLLKNRIIEDNAASFALALSQDWPTREFAIMQSTEFASFMSPTEVPVGDVAKVLQSAAVSAKIKQNIIESSRDYTAGADLTVLQAVAEYALRNSLNLPLSEIARHASAGVPSRLVVGMLQSHLETIGLDQLAPILRDLADPYPVITERNGTRPKLPNTTANLELVKRLKALEVVSTYKVNHELIVNMRRPTGR